jgi:hypothetical protein
VHLSPAALRVLGALAEKRLTTPQQYPLTLSALVTACNQRSAREPVTDLSEHDVQVGLRDLRDQELARTAGTRGRVSRYEHRLDLQLDLDDAAQTVLGVLVLRGPQTVGEIRTRTERWHEFADLEAVEAVLQRLATHPYLPLVIELEREPGRREARWDHLLHDPDAAPATTAAPPVAVATSAPVATASGLDARVTALEEEVADLRADLAGLRAALGEDRA